MSTNLEKVIEDNWEELKDTVRFKWNKLTSQDIKQIEGSYDILIGKIKKAYGSTRKEVEKELNELLSSDEFDEIEEVLSKKKSEMLEGAIDLKNQVSKYTQEYLQAIKDKSIEFEKSAVAYARENPLKVISTAAILCLAVTKIISVSKRI